MCPGAGPRSSRCMFGHPNFTGNNCMWLAKGGQFWCFGAHEVWCRYVVMFYYLLKLIHLFLCLPLCSFPSSYLSFSQSLPTIFPAVWVNLCLISQQPLQVTVCICLIGCKPGSAGPRHQLVFLWQRLLETWHLWLRMNGDFSPPTKH